VDSRALLIGDVFSNAATAVPDRLAVASERSSLSFIGLDRRANSTARALGSLGLCRGDRVVTLAGTGTDLVVLFAAAAKLGVVFAPLNPALSVEEAVATASPAVPTLVVGDDRRHKVAGELAATLAVPLARLEAIVGGVESDAAVEDQGIEESDPHVAFFTSGSSGTPKGAVLSHRTSYLRTHPGALLEPRGAMVCPYPLFHMGAWTIALQQWQARDAVILVSPGDAPSICDAVARYRATRLNCIPALWRRIIDYAGENGSDLSSLRYADTGTSATPLELLSAIESLAPRAFVRVFYGSTEAGSVASLEQSDFGAKPGSCGVPGPGVTVRVDGHGVLWVRGPLLFDGYFGDAAANSAVFDGDWFNTGDLAEIDADGYLSIIGRAGDVLRSGGESVVPVEVEVVLATHPKVADVAVIGIADADWGQLVCAAVVPTGDDGPSIAELREHCEGRLARHKQPRRMIVVDSIPRTASTGQIQRRLLAEQIG